MNSIVVEPYNPAWKEQFRELEAFFLQQLGPLIQRVEHVGSTSVPGLAAKPIIDIDLVIASESGLPAVIAALENLGYRYLGDLGIKDRYAFRVDTERSPATDPARPRHNLYCCTENGMGLKNHLALRNALRNNTALCKAYGELKQELAGQTGDIGVYVERKSAFIAQILLEQGFSAADAADIVRQNKSK